MNVLLLNHFIHDLRGGKESPEEKKGKATQERGAFHILLTQEKKGALRSLGRSEEKKKETPKRTGEQCELGGRGASLPSRVVGPGGVARNRKIRERRRKEEKGERGKEGGRLKGRGYSKKVKSPGSSCRSFNYFLSEVVLENK